MFKRIGFPLRETLNKKRIFFKIHIGCFIKTKKRYITSLFELKNVVLFKLCLLDGIRNYFIVYSILLNNLSHNLSINTLHML